MFGISPLGWVHTLGSLPAIPVAVYMFARHGRIAPRSTAGAIYFAAMLIGAGTVFLVARQPISYGIGAITLLFLLAGYGAKRVSFLGHAGDYIETGCLSVTAFLLMVPTISEILRRVPDGHPFITDPNSPILAGVMGGLLIILLIGLTAQIIHLHKQNKALATQKAQ